MPICADCDHEYDNGTNSLHCCDPHDRIVVLESRIDRAYSALEDHVGTSRVLGYDPVHGEDTERIPLHECLEVLLRDHRAQVTELEEKLAAAYEDDHRADQRIKDLESQLEAGCGCADAVERGGARIASLELALRDMLAVTDASIHGPVGRRIIDRAIALLNEPNASVNESESLGPPLPDDAPVPYDDQLEVFEAFRDLRDEATRVGMGERPSEANEREQSALEANESAHRAEGDRARGCRSPATQEEAMRRVVIESPYAGNVEENIAYARACVRDCLSRGESPYASHLFFTQDGILRDDQPEERKLGIEAGFAWGASADAVVVYVDRGISRGMEQGVARALAASQPVEFRSLYGADLGDFPPLAQLAPSEVPRR